jgi:signal transduction histidine kinase
VAAFALLCAGAFAAALWLGAEERPPTASFEGAKVLAAFIAKQPAALELDLTTRYGGRLELLDPRRTLPTWHKHDVRDATATYAALRTCAPPPVVADPDLAKAIEWRSATCTSARPRMEALAARPPFMHPSGSSYAELLFRETPRPDDAWLAAHARAFHVLELSELPAGALTEEERALAALPPAAFLRILEGDATVLTKAWIIHVSRDQYGPTTLSLRPRAAFDAFAERGGVALGPRSTACVEAESPVLCWREARAPTWRRTAARAMGASGAALLVVTTALLGAMVVRARREAARERVFLLRTLTHELRSPVTAMRLDVEPLRAAFDALPEECQEPMLRLSAGVERLSRVLEVTGRTLSLFDEENAERAPPITAHAIQSVNAYFEELTGEWPEDVALDLPAGDRAFVTDPDWLRVAVKNLVENAVKHGKRPVRVSARASDDELVVRVTDAGKTKTLSLAEAARPFAKGDGSTGLGLGLSLVVRIAEKQGGRLRHEPDPTTFELRMPQGKER